MALYSLKRIGEGADPMGKGPASEPGHEKRRKGKNSALSSLLFQMSFVLLMEVVRIFSYTLACHTCLHFRN